MAVKIAKSIPTGYDSAIFAARTLLHFAPPSIVYQIPSVLVAPGVIEVQAVAADVAVMDEHPRSAEFGPKFIEPAVQVFPPSILHVNSFIVKIGFNWLVLSNAFAQITFAFTIEILFKDLAGVANPVAASVQN